MLEESSIFLFDNKNYTLINGSLIIYENVSEIENVSINEGQEENENFRAGITGNVVSDGNFIKSFFERILRFFKF